MLAEGAGDRGPDWVEIVFDPGGDNLMVWNGWIWDKEPKILGGACGIIGSFISRMRATE
jgi:hypothetical protein